MHEASESSDSIFEKQKEIPVNSEIYFDLIQPLNCKGIINGFNKIEFCDGSLYNGFCKNGKFYGNYGYFSYSNGDSYRGAFKNNKREGRGSYIFKSGSIYNGLWINDEFNHVEGTNQWLYFLNQNN